MDINTMYKAMSKAYAVSKDHFTIATNIYAMGMIDMYILATGSNKPMILSQLEKEWERNKSI